MPPADERPLANQYRAQQQLLSSSLVRDLLRIIEALFDLGNPAGAWPVLRLALMPLIKDRRRQSQALAASYYVSLRREAGIDGPFTPPQALELDDRRMQASLDSVGLDVFDAAVRSGASPQQARDRMVVTIGGRAAYHALEGGRTVMKNAVEDDVRALGWIRVTDADPCAWCSMLASRGAVYKSALTAGHGRRDTRTADFQGAGEFKFHDYDQCHAIPIFHRDHPFEQNAADLYDQWRRVTAGESGAGARNAWRRYWDTRNSTSQGV